LQILKTFDDNTRANELIAKAHHECFNAMQKLLVDARVDKIAANDARRRARSRNVHTAAGDDSAATAVREVGDDSAAAAVGEVDDDSAAIAATGDDSAAAGDEDTAGGLMTPCPSPLEVDINNDAVFEDNLDGIFTSPKDPPQQPPMHSIT
jgi:hypothetical protein